MYSAKIERKSDLNFIQFYVMLLIRSTLSMSSAGILPQRSFSSRQISFTSWNACTPLAFGML